mgnify:CR=1 FL=1
MSARDESSLGDLVRVLAALRPTDRDVTAAITQLVLGPLARRPSPVARVIVPSSTAAPTHAAPTPAGASEPSVVQEPVEQAQESADELIALGRAPVYGDTPVWFSAPLPDDPTPVKPRLDPLFEPNWSRNLTSAFAATWAPDGDVDVPRVVATLSRGRAVTVLPRLLRLAGRPRLPLAREFLRLRDLLGRHASCDGVAVARGAVARHRRVEMRGREIEPHVGENIVLRHPDAGGVHDAEIVFGFRVSALRRELIPPGRLGIILRDAAPIVIHQTDL